MRDRSRSAAMRGRGFGGGGFSPASLGGLLAEYDFLKASGESATVLYDRKPGGGADGTVGAGATYSAYGLTPAASIGDSNASLPVSGVAWSSVRAAIVYVTPVGNNLLGSQTASGVQTPMYADLAGSLSVGQLCPRVRNLDSGANLMANISALRWPCSVAFTFGTTSKIYCSKNLASVYDAQSNLTAFALGSVSQNVTFGNNFVSSGNSPNTYHYCLLFDRELTADEVGLCHDYMASRCAGRNIPAGGPATITKDLLIFVGNSYTFLLNTGRMTFTQTFDVLKSHVYGGTPAQVLAYATQTVGYLYRPLAARNYVGLQLFPNADGATTFASAQAYSAYWKAYGANTKVLIANAISSAGNDAEKAIYNGLLADPTTGWSSFADGLSDWHSLAHYGPDGSYSNLSYYNADQLHPLDSGYQAEIEPLYAADVNALG